jgi:hypothetical protein
MAFITAPNEEVAKTIARFVHVKLCYVSNKKLILMFVFL